MTQEEMLIVKKLMEGDGWKLIKSVFEQHIARLSSIEEVDMNLGADEMKLEIKSRHMARDTIAGILNEFQGLAVQERPPANPLTRSLR